MTATPVNEIDIVSSFMVHHDNHQTMSSDTLKNSAGEALIL